MRRYPVGVLVTLTFSLCCASLPATAPPVGRVSRVGVLMPASAAVASPALQAFQQVLRERGYRESHTLVLEYRFAEGRYERLPSLAAELVRLPVDVLVAGSPSMIRAATQATTTIPIVGIGVPTGLFASLTRPGPNLTGIASGGEEVRKTGRALLEEIVPGLSRAAVLWDPHSGALRRRGLELGARLAGLRLQALEVQGPDELDRALAEATRGRAEALIVPGSGLFAMHQSRIAELALNYRLPTLAPFREFAEAGSFDKPLRKGMHEWGIMTGYGRSTAAGASKPNIDFFSLMPRFGYVFAELQGPFSLRGSAEVIAEAVPMLLPFESQTIYAGGLTGLLRYDLATGTRLVPFLEGGAGFLLSTPQSQDQASQFRASQFNFTLQIGAGLRYLVSEHVHLHLGYQIHHISDANTTEHNPGVNAHVVLLGFSLVP